MRALIADDEPIARAVLREQLEEFPSIEIVGEARTGPETLEMIAQLSPDVAFVDLDMPGMHGLSVARALGGRRPLIVFVTAYQEHALAAFDAGAVDYLLKPVRIERLSAALAKAQAQFHGSGPAPAADAGSRKIIGRLGSEMHVLDAADVVAFEADGELVHIITAKRQYLASHSLKALEGRLEFPRFRRIHRSTIINTEHIRTISPLSSKRWLLKMSNGMEAVVSKRLAGAIRDQMKW